MKPDTIAVAHLAVTVFTALSEAWDKREKRRMEAERDARDQRLADMERRVKELESKAKEGK